MNKFKVGDIVKLKSGGPDMTVTGIIGEDENLHICTYGGYRDGDLAVEYFSDKNLKKDIFHATSVSKVEK